jgi:hypothetical protein
VQGIVQIGTVEIERTQQERWLTGRLAPEWKRRFPELFDEDDLRLAQGPQGPKGYHFVEWLAAIVLHPATGYLVAGEQVRVPQPSSEAKDRCAALGARNLGCPS